MTHIGYDSRVVCCKWHSIDLSSHQFKCINSFNTNYMVCTLYSYEMQSDFISLIKDYLIWWECKWSKIPCSYLIWCWFTSNFRKVATMIVLAVVTISKDVCYIMIRSWVHVLVVFITITLLTLTLSKKTGDIIDFVYKVWMYEKVTLAISYVDFAIT